MSRRPILYGISTRCLAESWLVYVSEAYPSALKSSNVVIVRRSDGRILYCGSACDEG